MFRSARDLLPRVSSPSLPPLTGNGLQERTPNRAVYPLFLLLHAVGSLARARYRSLANSGCPPKKIRPPGRAVFYVRTRRNENSRQFFWGDHTKMICPGQHRKQPEAQQQSLRSLLPLPYLCLLVNGCTRGSLGERLAWTQGRRGEESLEGISPALQFCVSGMLRVYAALSLSLTLPFCTTSFEILGRLLEVLWVCCCTSETRLCWFDFSDADLMKYDLMDDGLIDKLSTILLVGGKNKTKPRKSLPRTRKT